MKKSGIYVRSEPIIRRLNEIKKLMERDFGISKITAPQVVLKLMDDYERKRKI